MLTTNEHKKFKKYANKLDVARMATAFDALGEPNRCRIFRALVKFDNASVGQLAEALNLSGSLTSQHLKVLLHANLVVKERCGKNVCYDVRHDDPLVRTLEKVMEI
ncbi:MAG: ArsR/SmtB family transcription factor [Candidatus Saccharimonadales bacterium]